MKHNYYRTLLSIFCLITIFMVACGGKEAVAPAPSPSSQPVSVASAVPRETPIPGKIGSDTSSSTNTSSPTSTSSSTTANASGLRPVDQKIIAQLGTAASGDKIKDAFPRESYKVNFYREAGEAGWTRLKVDLNRNEKWDEKWDLANGQPVKRQVSSKDDDSTYDQKFVWRNGKWEPEK